MVKIGFEFARQKYKPDKINFLLIAEAPPRVESGRFFYFEDVQDADILFLETMKAIYPVNCSNTRRVRQRKGEFLERFKNDGFYLIDASDRPMEDNRPSKKKRQIKNSLPSLIEKVRSLVFFIELFCGIRPINNNIEITVPSSKFPSLGICYPFFITSFI